MRGHAARPATHTLPVRGVATALLAHRRTHCAAPASSCLTALIGPPRPRHPSSRLPSLLPAFRPARLQSRCDQLVVFLKSVEGFAPASRNVVVMALAQKVNLMIKGSYNEHEL